jgi:purine-binding chemotaxis protein CheW
MTSSADEAGDDNSLLPKFNRVITDEDRRRILSERAKLLSTTTEESGIASTDLLYVFEFRLGEQTFAFDTKFVREVLASRNVAAIPCTPPFVAGVINVRGEIITVIDTRLLFGFPSQGIPPTSKIVVVSHGDSQMGFLVDAVVGISELSRREIQPPLSTTSAQQARYVTGVTAAPMTVIDLEFLINDPSILVDEEVE